MTFEHDRPTGDRGPRSRVGVVTTADDPPLQGAGAPTSPTAVHTGGRATVAAVIFAVVTVAVAALGSLATSAGMDWYDGLERPAFTPPDATFGIVWTVLYAAVAVAGWLAWRATTNPAPTRWWAVQMTLNLAWTVAFFGLQSPVAGIVVIAALLVAIAGDVAASWRVSRPAGALLTVYLAWCLFAAALTIGVAALN